MRRFCLSITAGLLLASGCAAATTADPAGLEPDTADAAATAPEPEADPEPTLEDRWRAPFAVISRGRTAVRPERPVIQMEATASNIGGSSAASPDTVRAGSARVPRDTASAAAGLGVGERDGTKPPPAGVGEQPRTPADREPPGAEPARRTHRVEWGETWFGITRRYGVSRAALAAANPDVDPERLQAGEVLLIPSPDSPASGQRTHTVVAGDSLWGISRRYGVSLDRLRGANRLSDDRVRIGQVLIIP